MGGLSPSDDRLAHELAETLHDVTVVLATLRKTEGYGPDHGAVRALDRFADELVALWASYVESPATETRRRIEDRLERWVRFDPRRL